MLLRILDKFRGIICTVYVFFYFLGLKTVKNSLKTAKVSLNICASFQRRSKNSLKLCGPRRPVHRSWNVELVLAHYLLNNTLWLMRLAPISSVRSAELFWIYHTQYNLSFNQPRRLTSDFTTTKP